MYAIIDIETTGGQYNQEGITEIAIYKFDGHQVVEQFISLVNPERTIQDFVVKLTGINNKMLKNAPKFYEIAKRIVEITQNCIIVAHNAEFDYRMLRTEFKRLGFDYQRPTLCTIELSKKLFPEVASYSLGKLVRTLGIPISDRHRAQGDALATLQLFKLLLTKDINKTIITHSVKEVATNISPHLLQILDELPTQAGVYYIYNPIGKILFIGRGKNIKKNVNQHFISKTKRDLYIQKHVYKVMYELTGNDLIAQLKEHQEITQNKPTLNTPKRAFSLPYGLFCRKNKDGYLELSIEMIHSKTSYWARYKSKEEGTNVLFEMLEKFCLCSKLTGFSQAPNHCYNFTINKCKGACIKKEPSEQYNQRVWQCIENHTFRNQTFLIIDKGRVPSEKSVILIENGEFKGYGYANLNHQLKNMDILKNIITPMPSSPKINYLIQNYIRKNKVKEIIKLSFF